MSRGNTPKHPDKCDHCMGSVHSICGHVGRDRQMDLQRLSTIRTFAEDDTIQAEGEDCLIAGTILAGFLRLVKTLPDGRQQIVGILQPSDHFGRIFSNDDSGGLFAIEAASDVRLCCFDRQKLECLLRSDQDLSHFLYRSALKELDCARMSLVLLGCKTAVERIASFLLMMLDRDGRRDSPGTEHVWEGAWSSASFALRGTLQAPRGSGDVIFIPISRRDMAIYLATTAETISRTIQLLAKQKIIDILDNRHFRLNNLDALRRISASSTPTPTPGHRPPMPPTFLGNRH